MPVLLLTACAPSTSLLVPDGDRVPFWHEAEDRSIKSTVRIRTAEGTQFARSLRVESDSVRFRDASSSTRLAVPLREVDRVSFQGSGRSRKNLGLWAGTLIGFVLGFLADPPESGDFQEVSVAPYLGGLAGGVLGYAWGAGATGYTHYEFQRDDTHDPLDPAAQDH